MLEPDVPDPDTPPTGSPPDPAPVRPRRGYFLPGVIALAALVALGVLLGAGDLEHPTVTTLAGPEVASQIALGIQAQQGSAAPPTVTCPAKEPARQGFRFDCTLQGHPARPVHVTELNGRGGVSWSLGR